MAESLDDQRRQIGDLLTSGLATDSQQRAYTDADIQRVLKQLNALAPEDLTSKLRVAGFTATPYVGDEDPDIEQSCSTCMYYEAHRRYCALPELKLAVEPQWSCVLWRI